MECLHRVSTFFTVAAEDEGFEFRAIEKRNHLGDLSVHQDEMAQRGAAQRLGTPPLPQTRDRAFVGKT